MRIEDAVLIQEDISRAIIQIEAGARQRARNLESPPCLPSTLTSCLLAGRYLWFRSRQRFRAAPPIEKAIELNQAMREYMALARDRENRNFGAANPRERGRKQRRWEESHPTGSNTRRTHTTPRSYANYDWTGGADAEYNAVGSGTGSSSSQFYATISRSQTMEEADAQIKKPGLRSIGILHLGRWRIVYWRVVR